MTRRLREDRGSFAVELLVAVPLIALLLLGGLQVVLAAVCVSAAENAARAGARGASLGQDGGAVAEQALSPGLRPSARVTITAAGGSVSATVDVAVPRVFPALPHRFDRVLRTAEMPAGPAPWRR